MCPTCEGLGRVSDLDVNELVDVERSLNDGAITVPNFAVDSWYWQTIVGSGLFDPDVKLQDFTPQQWDDFLHKPATKIKVGSNNWTYEGLVVKVKRLFLAKDRESMQPHIRAFVDRAVTFTSCARLRRHPAQRGGPVVADRRAQHRRLLRHADQRPGRVRPHRSTTRGPRHCVANLRDLLDSLVEIGLGYLSLDRESAHPLRRRGAAGEDGPAPRLQPHRRHVRLRRTHSRPAPARHRRG